METKVPFYNVVNILIPGLVFIGASAFLFLDKIKDLAINITTLGSTSLEVLLTVASFAIAYEVGYIIFRLGAAIIEPILKKMFGWREYSEFVAARKAGAESLDTLSREYGYARTHITLFVALVLIAAIRAQWMMMSICLIFVILFTLTARGHIKKIIATVDRYLPQAIIETTQES